MAQIYETHTVQEREIVREPKSGSAMGWVAFIVVALLIAGVAFFLLSPRATLTAPDGSKTTIGVTTAPTR